MFFQLTVLALCLWVYLIGLLVSRHLIQRSAGEGLRGFCLVILMLLWPVTLFAALFWWSVTYTASGVIKLFDRQGKPVHRSVNLKRPMTLNAAIAVDDEVPA
jgi:ethanolamine transporter EutH